ncbi:HEAT repeat domain-containing protein [Chitinophaga sp. 22620]|uniref:HEAT repeat domain-containing protein n=1 Tax=Chitinophaga sp. 22620 TaxID=3453952 RepID=UPI003F87E898
MIKPTTIPEHTLYAYTAFFAAIILLILIFTRIYLGTRKRRFLIEKNVQAFFDQWLGQMLLGEFSEDDEIEIPEELQDRRKYRVGRQYAINQLINTKKNLIGLASRNVIYLYEKLGLKKSSLKKFHSRLWYKKAKGIYELYMMEQQDMQPLIHPFTNSSNEYVRTEAQTALLAFSGFKGLSFLSTLKYPMNAWQQVKLLEQLQPLDPGHFEALPSWLVSANDSVVIFALKLAEIYQQMQVKEEAIACLKHDNPKVRGQAIQALVRIGDDATPAVLQDRYLWETEHNRTLILEALEHIANDEVLPFLERELENDDPAVKLRAARAIARNVSGGMGILQHKAAALRDPYEKIYLHIKSEMTR